MIKVGPGITLSLIILILLLALDFEEEPGCSGKEEAKHECRSDSCAERLHFTAFACLKLIIEYFATLHRLDGAGSAVDNEDSFR